MALRVEVNLFWAAHQEYVQHTSAAQKHFLECPKNTNSEHYWKSLPSTILSLSSPITGFIPAGFSKAITQMGILHTNVLLLTGTTKWELTMPLE